MTGTVLESETRDKIGERRRACRSAEAVADDEHDFIRAWRWQTAAEDATGPIETQTGNLRGTLTASPTISPDGFIYRGQPVVSENGATAEKALPQQGIDHVCEL